MREIKLEEFRKVIKGITLRYGTVPDLDKDDIEQELWEKLIEVFPKTSHLEPGEREKFVNTSLRNKARDLLRYTRTRYAEQNFSNFCPDSDEEVSYDEVTTQSFVALGMAIHADGGQNSRVSMSFLISKLHQWAWAHKSPTIVKSRRQFIRELVAPSEKCLAIWRKHAEECPSSVTVNTDLSMPVIAEALGVSKQNIRRNVVSLRKYLAKFNYSLAEAV